MVLAVTSIFSHFLRRKINYAKSLRFGVINFWHACLSRATSLGHHFGEVSQTETEEGDPSALERCIAGLHDRAAPAAEGRR